MFFYIYFSIFFLLVKKKGKQKFCHHLSPLTCNLSPVTCNLSPVIHNLQHHPQHPERVTLVTLILSAVFTEHGVVSTSCIVRPPDTV